MSLIQIGWILFFFYSLIVVYKNHYHQKNTDGAGAEELRKIKKLKKNSYRDHTLTIQSGHDNRLAHLCFLHIKSKMMSIVEASRGGSCRSTFGTIFCGFLIFVGVFGIANVVSKEEEMLVYILSFYMVFVPIPFLIYFNCSSLNIWETDDQEAITELMGEALDSRIKVNKSVIDHLKDYEPHFQKLNDGEENKEESDEDDPRKTNTPGFPNDDMFTRLQRVGYASIPSWALYASSINRIITSSSSYYISGDDDVNTDRKVSEFIKLHGLWFDTILPKALLVYETFTNSIDDNRKRAVNRLNNQAVSTLTGGIGDVMNTASTVADAVSSGNSVMEMKELIKEMKGVVDDIKEIKQIVQNTTSVPGKKTDNSNNTMKEHRGIHPLLKSKEMAYVMFMFVWMVGWLIIASFNVPNGNGATIGTCVLVFFLGLSVFMYKIRLNQSTTNNAVEDMISMEIHSRKIMEEVSVYIIEDKDTDSDMKNLICATNELRRLLMDNFYAAFAIHASNQCLTYRSVPYGSNAPMLFPCDDIEIEVKV